jgi:hypothetical protein
MPAAICGMVLPEKVVACDSIKKNRVQQSAMKIRETISFSLLVLVYLLVSLRYFPGEWMRTLLETFWHLLSIFPYTLGVTVLIVAVLRRIFEGKKLSLPLVIRIFITVSIFLELFLGIHDYISRMQSAV